MSWIFIASWSALCVALLIAERKGLRTTLELTFKGDVKRESRWFAQYGQSACTPVASIIVTSLDPRGWKVGLLVVVAPLVTSTSVMILKRLFGRVRPNRENAGKFLGPSFKHANYRESFPSSHSACAVALTVALVFLYPNGFIIFWVLAGICALLRYVLDAHWPSDVVGGIAIGYVLAHLTILAWPPAWLRP
jgi:membrane-associated phospholipid phosphatase